MAVSRLASNITKIKQWLIVAIIKIIITNIVLAAGLHDSDTSGQKGQQLRLSW